jgi:acetyl-CoA acyltransferase
MDGTLNRVVVVDAVRTPFGRAGEKGLFWNTRADDLVVPLLKALIERNPGITPDMIEDNIWGVTNQVKEQGGTIGRAVSMLADWGYQIPGCSIDRMCAGGLTAVGFAAATVAAGMADCLIAGGVEHMGHLPMGFMRDPHPRLEEVMGGPSAFNMGLTAENIHDRFPEFTREMADQYALNCQQKADKAIRGGKMKDMIIPMEVTLADGMRMMAEQDQPPRPTTTLEGLSNLKTPFREGGRVTAGNASGLNDGACAVLLMNEEKARELGLQPKMRFVSSAVAAVDPTIMGIAPVPATQKALQKAGLTMNDMDLVELNEAFAVQALYFMDRMGMAWDDDRVNRWGGAIAYGHPLAASGPRLVAFLAGLFKENPQAKYGLATMCVGRGQGYSVIWENLQSTSKP